MNCRINRSCQLNTKVALSNSVLVYPLPAFKFPAIEDFVGGERPTFGRCIAWETMEGYDLVVVNFHNVVVDGCLRGNS